MRHRSLTGLIVVLALLLGSFGASPLLGEDTPQPANPQPLPQQPQQPTQPQPKASRDKGAANAAAMAAMGAAMAGMSCMMMMKMAQEEQDPKMKQMIMMQAMQQCAQAAQSAANAGQNKEAEKGAQDAAPAQPQFQAPTMAQQPKDDDKDDKNLLAAAPKETEAEAPRDTTPIVVEPLKIPVQAKAGDDKATPLPGAAPTLPPATSIPKEIDKAMITANENAKEGGAATDADSKVMGLGGFGGGKANTAGDDLKKATSDGDLANADRPLKRARGNAEPEMGGGSGGDGGSSSSGSAGGDPFDQMLSQLLGGGPGAPGMEMGFGGGGIEITSLPKTKDPKKSMNIFQFANSWYGRLGRTDSRLRIRPNSSRANPIERGLSSGYGTSPSASTMPNSVVQASVP